MKCKYLKQEYSIFKAKGDEKIETINQLMDFLLIIIRLGIVFRVTYCFIRISVSPDEAPQYKKRLTNGIVALVLAEGIFMLRDLLLTYFGR